MMTSDEIIEVARRREAGLPDADRVRQAAVLALSTGDLSRVALCLDCFRSIVGESKGPEVQRIVATLGKFLVAPELVRMRLLILKTVGDTMASWTPILDQLEAARGRPRTNAVRRWRRGLLRIGAWEALESADPRAWARGVELFEDQGEIGRGNLLALLRKHPHHEYRRQIEEAIERLARRIPEHHQSDWWK